jgi:multidrug efflux pump subunit AcrB
LVQVSGSALPPEEMEDKITNPIEKELKTISNIKEDNEFLMGLALSGGDLPVLYNIAKTTIKDRIEAVNGVKKVDIAEDNISNQIQITFKPEQLSAYDVTPKDVADRLQEANTKQAIGTLKNPGFDTVVEVDNSLSSIEQLNSILIETPKGQVPLSDLASIEDMRGQKPKAIFRYNARVIIEKTIPGTFLPRTFPS